MKEEDEQPDEEAEEEAEDEDDGAPEVAQVAPVPVPAAKAAKGAKKKQLEGATADEDGWVQSVEGPSMLGNPPGKRQRRAKAH